MEDKVCGGNSQPEDGSSCQRLTWKIDSFSNLNVKKLYSDVFYVEGYKWRILIFPKGNEISDHLSIYLVAVDSETLPNGWSRHAHFNLLVISQIQNFTFKKGAQHTFNARETSWGFLDFMPLSELNDSVKGYLKNGSFTIEAEVRLDEEQSNEELKRKKKSDSLKEPTSIEAEKNSYSFAEFDALFTDIKNLLGETNKKIWRSFYPSSSSTEEIANAKKIFKQCLDMDLSSIIDLKKVPELKKSLAIMLSTNAFTNNMVDETTKFLEELDQSCDLYESAKQDLSKAHDDEKEKDELKATLKQRYLEFISVRKQTETVDLEIARLEKQLIESKAKKARLSKRLDDLAHQATTSKEALVSAKQRMKLSAVKKEQAKKIVSDIENSWETLKVGSSLLH